MIRSRTLLLEIIGASTLFLLGSAAAQVTITPAPSAQVSVAAPSMAAPVAVQQVQITGGGSALHVTASQSSVQIQQPIRQVTIPSTPQTIIRPVPKGVEVRQGNRSSVSSSVIISGGSPPPEAHASHTHPHPPERKWTEERHCYLDANNRLQCYTLRVPRN